MMRRSWQSLVVNFLLRVFIRTRDSTGSDPADIRVRSLKVYARLGSSEINHAEDISVSGKTIDGMDAQWISNRRNDRGKIILYLHGGGFYMPAVGLHTKFLGELCAMLDCDGVMPDYRLAPENQFPAAPDDCLASYQWLLQQGYAAQDIVLAGDSAGGNLCLTTLMSARDQGLPMPACAVLLSPASDACFTGTSIFVNAKRDPLFTVPLLFWMRSNYLAKADPWHPKASPLHGSFDGLPPLMFHAGSTELILDGSVLAAEKARQQGVDAGIAIWPGMPHVFPLLSWLPEARAATRQITEFIQSHS